MAPTDTAPAATRQRKVHRKSRYGCKNCKMRSVKCDEAKPSCKRCVAGGFVCSFTSTAPALPLQLARPGAGAGTEVLPIAPAPAPARTSASASAPAPALAPAPPPGRVSHGPIRGLLLPMSWIDDAAEPRSSEAQHGSDNSSSSSGSEEEGALTHPYHGMPWRPRSPQVHIPVVGSGPGGREGLYELRTEDLIALDRFWKRSSWALGNSSSRSVFRQGAYKLGLSNPYVLHAYISVSLLHDFDLSHNAPTARQRRLFAFHTYNATALFSTRLALGYSQPVADVLSPQDRDALWACSVCLGVIGFGNTETTDPREIWPARSRDAAFDLDWLNLSTGKHAVWKIANPTRPDSTFQPLYKDGSAAWYSNPFSGERPVRRETLPPGLYELCGLDETSVPGANPYFAAASLISQILGASAEECNIITFMAFVGQLDQRYRALLSSRDPVALLLLVYWFAKMCPYVTWWLKRRCLVTGRSICVFLERDYGHNTEIVKLLKYPNAMFHYMLKIEKSREEIEQLTRELMPGVATVP